MQYRKLCMSKKPIPKVGCRTKKCCCSLPDVLCYKKKKIIFSIHEDDLTIMKKSI